MGSIPLRREAVRVRGEERHASVLWVENCLRLLERNSTGPARDRDVPTSGADGSPPWPTLAMRERVAICQGAMHSARLPDGRRLSVSLPRKFEEVVA